MMNIKLSLAAAALLAACLPAVHAQNAAPAPAPPAAAPPAAPATAAAPVTLRLKFTPGQTLYYSMTADTDGTIFMGQTGAEMPLKNHIEMLLHQTVKDVRASDGAATIDTGVDSMTMSMNGQSFPLPPDQLAKMKSVGTVVLLPTGKTLSFTPNPALGGAAVPGMDMSHANPLGSLGQFPDAPVKAGDTWKSAVAMGMMGAQVAAEFTLTSLDTTGGKTIALLNQTINGTFDTSSANGAAAPTPTGMKMKGSVAGKGTLHFDVDAGAVVDQTSQANITMSVMPPGTTAPVKVQIKMNSTMTRASAPVPAANPAVQ
jgi:hypothetical protein